MPDGLAGGPPAVVIRCPSLPFPSCWVAEVGDLGSGAGRRAKVSSGGCGGWAGQIDEDVDVFGLNEDSQLSSDSLRQSVPSIDVRSKPVCDLVRPLQVGET